MNSKLTIGNLCKIFDVTTDAVRYYEKLGLLNPIKDTNNGYRYYTDKDIEMLELILISKFLETPLSNLKQLINNPNTENYSKHFLTQESEIMNKISELKRMLEENKKINMIIEDIKNYERNNVPLSSKVQKDMYFEVIDVGDKNLNKLILAKENKLESFILYKKHKNEFVPNNDEILLMEITNNYITSEGLIMIKKGADVINFLGTHQDILKLLSSSNITSSKIIIEYLFTFNHNNYEENIYFVNIFINL